MEHNTTHALRFCNKIRRQLNLESVADLQKGKKGMSGACPIANTIAFESNVDVTVYRELFVYNRVQHPANRPGVKEDYIIYDEKVPPLTFRWIQEFDSGEHAEYDVHSR